MKTAKAIKIFLGLCLFFGAASPAAADSLALTITPPLLKINMNGGESLATSIKVVNNNSDPLTVYLKVVDFKDGGSRGLEFLAPPEQNEENNRIYLSRWIELNQESVDLGPSESRNLPFTISAPQDAAPGGHYAAILVGTNPPEEIEGGSVVKVSSYIASLIFLKVSGEIVEKGLIRDFYLNERLYHGGRTSFTLRFQNQGNVHLRPSGTIKISDVFGRDRGSISVNESRDFGNVLPEAEREWKDLSWEDKDFFLINRYKAELSFSFGEEAKQTDVRYFYFWAVDWKWLIIILSAVVLFILLLIFSVRAYIRSSVKNLERRFRARERRTSQPPVQPARPEKRMEENKKVIDLRKRK